MQQAIKKPQAVLPDGGHMSLGCYVSFGHRFALKNSIMEFLRCVNNYLSAKYLV
jgi:hypothetical protein